MKELKNITETVVEHTPMGEYWGVRFKLTFSTYGENDPVHIAADAIVGGDGL